MTIPPKLVIFDLDNTLYREPPGLGPACEIAMAKAMSEMVPDLSYEVALEISISSNHHSGSVRTYFDGKYDIDQHDLHERFHDYVDHCLLPVCKNTQASFAAIDQEKTALGLLTHGSMDWTRRVLGHLGLAEFFSPALILPTEQVSFARKNESEEPFRQLLARAEKALGQEIAPSQTLMIEDAEKNLEIPHSMGMQTILILHGREAGDWPHVHHQIEAVSDAIENFIAKAA